MKIALPLLAIVLLLSAQAPRAAPLDYIIINHSLVANKLMPAGTEVKVRVVKIADEFNTTISVDCFPESAFTPETPSNIGYSQKTWLAVDTLAGDVLSYTTTRRCFVGISANPEYYELYLGPVADGYRQMTLGNWSGQEWILEVRFPDYD